MEDNSSGALVGSILALGKIVTKPIKNTFSNILDLTWNEYKFEKIFKNTGLKNYEGEIPDLNGWIDECVYNLYKFSIPAGLSLEDFEKIINPLALFMKLDPVNLKFKVANDFSSIQLFKFNFEELYKEIDLKNSKGIYPKLLSTNIENDNFTWLFNLPEGITIRDFEIKINELKKITKINDLKFKEINNEGTSYIELRL